MKNIAQRRSSRYWNRDQHSANVDCANLFEHSYVINGLIDVFVLPYVFEREQCSALEAETPWPTPEKDLISGEWVCYLRANALNGGREEPANDVAAFECILILLCSFCTRFECEHEHSRFNNNCSDSEVVHYKWDLSRLVTTRLASYIIWRDWGGQVLFCPSASNRWPLLF